MKFFKNKFYLFYIFNIITIIFLFVIAIPIYKFLNKINLDDNQYVSDQLIINPQAKSSDILDREVQIKFVAKVDKALEWNFKTLQEVVNVKIGENKIIRYEGKNLSNKTLVSTANFNVSPEIILPYLIKTECFCFTEQTLLPGESKIFTMVFFLDPSMDSDINLDNLKELVFTYEFSEYKS